MDINSLYPTALTRLKGYPLGSPKNIPKEDLINKTFINYADEYYLKILITKVNRKLHFQLLSRVDKTGARIWTNDVEGENIYVDRITLEDLVKYHEIEYECKAGVMFNEGHNPKIANVVKDLYEQRMKYKKENNPLEALIKLILNTAYGKTIERPHVKELKYFRRAKECVYSLTARNGKTIEEIELIDNKKIKVKLRKGISDNWALPHCGTLVLSESKRIMSEAMVPVDEYIKYTHLIVFL